MNYGQLLDTYEPDKEYVFTEFSKYFNNPMLRKIKDVDIFSVYMSKTYCLLTNECRYIVVFVEKDDKPLDSVEELNVIKWISFQTRTMSDKHNLPPHNYISTRNTPLMVNITRVNKNKEFSVYSCEKYPLDVTLLHVKRDDEYSEKGTLISALETYQTIITFNK